MAGTGPAAGGAVLAQQRVGAVRVLAVALALVAAIAAVPSAGSADAPPEFTGGDPEATSAAGTTTTAAPAADEPAADPVPRYFGREPWEAIEASAAAAARPCAVSNNGLTAMVVAPVFKESSTATSPALAPAPMTLARYDEWNGTYATTSNAAANYGLYAFRDPNTPYKRAFWHPGIGIWQYDSAGVGAPFTAVERMDVRVTSADVATAMMSRYCNPSSSLIGHGAPFTGLERRYAAWSPWGYPCRTCEQEFQAMTATSPAFSDVTLVDGISVLGGVERRTCTLRGVVGSVTCWYVDPSVGVIEGATGWAQIKPLDGGSPTSTPTPLAEAFYVVDRGATEERHWLRVDTGYAIDIAGTRTIGTNERPRSNQAGSGVTWRSGSGLCDLDTGHGDCLPPAPAGLTLTPLTVNGSFRAIPLDAQGDGAGDVLWYAPGAAPDSLWSGAGSGTFRSTALNIGGTYDDVLPLDVDGDGDDDLLWYNRSTGGTYLWLGDGTGRWEARKITRPKGLRPLVVDTDGNGRDEVFWYGPGTVADALWSWNGSAFTSRSQSVGGSYRGLTGDFDGNGKTDLLWYAAGSAPDHLWLSTGLGAHRDVPLAVGGTYTPLVGDYDGDRDDDVFWYGVGTAPDALWFGGPQGAFTSQGVKVNGTYRPAVADLEGDGRDDIVWYAPGPGSDVWWRWGGDRSPSSAALIADGSHQAVVGSFSARGGDGILWYAPGTTADGLWWR